MTYDYSTCHETVSHLFSIPATREDWERFRLTDEQVAFYHENEVEKGISPIIDKSEAFG